MTRHIVPWAEVDAGVARTNEIKRLLHRNGPILALLVALAGCTAPREEPASPEAEARARTRHARRAYDGAPPVVPHAVAALGREECLACHQEGLDLGDEGLAPRTPHPERVVCLQCHVEQAEGATVFVANRFEGARHAARGTRASVLAPPTVPHPRQGREQCLGCHGENGGSPIRTPHPERVLCLQCHVTRAADAPGFPEPPAGGRS